MYVYYVVNYSLTVELEKEVVELRNVVLKMGETMTLYETRLKNIEDMIMHLTSTKDHNYTPAADYSSPDDSLFPDVFDPFSTFLSPSPNWAPPHSTDPPTHPPHSTDPPTHPPHSTDPHTHSTDPPTHPPHFTDPHTHSTNPPTHPPHFTDPPTHPPRTTDPHTHSTDPPTHTPHFTDPPTHPPHCSSSSTRHALPLSQKLKNLPLHKDIVCGDIAKVIEENIDIINVAPGTVAQLVAREAVFGSAIMSQCTPNGSKTLKALPQKELMMIKEAMFQRHSCNDPHEFEKVWSVCHIAIEQACGRARRALLKNKRS